MFQTEFCGSDYKFIILWDTENCQSYSFKNNVFSDQDVFYKLNELYENISKFSTEFVECVKSVHGSTNLEQLQDRLHENNPNVTFKIENVQNKQSSEEVSSLCQRIERLLLEKEELIAEHEKQISDLRNDFDQRTKDLIYQQDVRLNLVKQELENKYNLEMSDLRTYFENKCTESIRHFTEESYQCSRDSDSDSYSEIEADDENYEAINSSSKFADSNLDHATKDIQKLLDKELKNIRKAYQVEVDKLKEDLKKKKDDEIREMKQNLEVKYTAKFESLQAQLDCLINEKNLEDSVHSVYSQVKQDYEDELDKLQTISDYEYASKIENDLILKHNEELSKRDQEWRDHLESSLSDIAVESALKSVIKDNQYKSKSCHCSPSKKQKYKEGQNFKQKYKKELDDIKQQFESELESVKTTLNSEIQKANIENNALICQNKDLLEINEKCVDEIASLKKKLAENIHLLQNLQENEIIDKIKDELSKMKTRYEIEVGSLRDDKYDLEKVVDELQEKLRNIENNRQNIISSLYSKIKELTSEESEEEPIWPEELNMFRELFHNFESRKMTLSNERHNEALDEQKVIADTTSVESVTTDDLEEILQQRETLRKVILTLYSACEGFRKYITTLDEDRNAILTGELQKLGLPPSSLPINLTFDDILSSLNDTEKETLNKIQRASNVLEITGLLGDETMTNLTLDCNKTFNQSELSGWFEKLKNDAAAILCLTSGRKVDVEDDMIKSDTETQIEDGNVQRRIEYLENEIASLQEKYTDALDEIEKRAQEVDRLNKKINSMESLEGYGEDEGPTAGSKSFDAFNQEEYCLGCDKLREEAKREKDDLESQIEAASKKLRSYDLFLERETAEREQERDEFDKKLCHLQDQLKERERELSTLQTYSGEIATLENQLRELTDDYEQTKIRNETLEQDFNSINDKLWTLRDRNRELELKLAQKSELAENTRIELEMVRGELTQLQQDYQTVRQELDSMQDNGTKQLDYLQEQHEISSAMVKQMKNQLMEVEKMLMCRTRELENNYVTVSSSTVPSSPSEDVSVCDRIADRLNQMSPAGTDMPVDLLVCFNEKLKKLFRAEDAALKRIQDYEMQINKMSLIINELQLEKETLQDTLNETTNKLSEAKIELNNWQHRSNTEVSEITAKLTSTIESLQYQADQYQKLITSKDTQIKELSKKIDHLNSYIKTAETEYTDQFRKIQKTNENLQKEVIESNEEIYKLNELLYDHRNEPQENLSLSTIVEKLLQEKNEQILQLEDKLEVFKSLAEIGNKSHSTEIDSKSSSTKRVNFTETLESYHDVSDQTRHAAVVSDVSLSPKFISASSSGVKKPLLGSSASNESSFSLQPIQEIDEVFVKPDSTLHKEVTFKDTSFENNLNDLTWTPNQLSNEHSEEQYSKLEQEVENLTQELTLKQTLVKTLESQLAEMQSLKITVQQLQTAKPINEDQFKQKDHRITELTTLLEAEKTKMREMNENYEKWFKAVVEERVQAEIKCDEFARQIENMTKELNEEKSKAEKLSKVVERVTQKQVRNAQVITEPMADDEQVAELRDRVLQLEAAIEQARNRIEELQRRNEYLQKFRDEDGPATNALGTGGISSENGSLSSLTQQVQNEVDLAAMLDENMMQNLELGIVTSECFLEELRKSSPVKDSEVREILVKILQHGFETLNSTESNTLRRELYAFDDAIRIQIELLNKSVENLTLMLEKERKLNKDVGERNYDLQLQMNRLVTAHGYAEDRITFLAGKMNEYRDKAVKMEIEYTTEKTTRRQIELAFDQYKKQTAEKKATDSKKLEEIVDQLNSTCGENLKLKQECGVLRNKIDSLIAELNSVKAITQYHSDSETELSRSLNPLKERIADMEEKYSRLKYDYEKKKIELRTIRCNLNQERGNRKNLESIVKELSTEKHKVEKQLIDMKSKLEEVTWLKKKIEDKLNAAETAEVARRIIISSQGDTHRKELQSSTELQRKLQKECQDFQKNITKLVEELSTSKSNCRQIVVEAQKIFLRMMKAEHSQRSLIYQKNYLVVTLCQYESKCKNIARSIVARTRNQINHIANEISVKQKFRSYVLCLISIHRMKFLNKRRIHSNCVKMKNYFISHVPEIAARNDECFEPEAIGRL